MTAIEFLIALLCVAVMAFVVWASVTSQPTTTVQWGFNGPVETRCVAGTKVLVGSNGHIEQMRGPDGKPLPCN